MVMGRSSMPMGIKPAAKKAKTKKPKGYAMGGKINTVVPADMPTPMNKGGRAKKGC